MDWNSRRITAIIENALLEDRATRDATSYACIDPNQRASATILAKQDCILAGIGCVSRILDVYAALDGAVTSHYEVTTHPEIFDGVRLHKGQSIAVIRHNARVILSCERVILNFMQRLSGIATLTRKFVDAVSGTKARILDTRKTAPGLRMLDKYAVRCGGGQNHRLDLSDGVLIKNNHIALAGGIVPALERAHKNRRGEQIIEIEVRSLEELEQALEHGGEAILLDNMSVDDVKRAVERCSQSGTPHSVGGLGRNHAGKRARLRRDRSEFHLGRRAHSFGAGSGSEHASGASLVRAMLAIPGVLASCSVGLILASRRIAPRLHFRVTIVAWEALEYSEALPMSRQIRHTAVAILVALLFANSSSGSGGGPRATAPSASTGAVTSVPVQNNNSSRPAAVPNPPTNSVNVTVDALADRHAISPYVYGGSYPKDAPTITDSGLSVVRWGGNATSRYNWKTFTNNAAADWYFEDFGYTEIGDGDSTKYIQDVKAAGSNPLMTMVMLPWVAKTSGWSFSVAKYGAQCGADPYNSDAGDGVLPDCQTAITGNDPTDANVELKDSPQNGDPPGTVYRDQWAPALAAAFGSAPHFYNMDNEIDIWGGTHRDIHPTPTAYDEMRDTYVAEAAR